jgi:hypothetical protein
MPHGRRHGPFVPVCAGKASPVARLQSMLNSSPCLTLLDMSDLVQLDSYMVAIESWRL